MEMVFGLIGILVPTFFFVGIPILIVIHIIKSKRYTKNQIESGEDKRLLLNFANTLFNEPQNYTYAVGNNTVAKRTGSRTTTFYYFSYLLAFNQNEFHIISFRSDDHKPVFRNLLTFNFAEMQLTHKKTRTALELDIYCAGQKQHITVSNIVKGDNMDKSDTPFAVEQSREVQFLEQMVIQYEMRSYQIQKGNN